MSLHHELYVAGGWFGRESSVIIDGRLPVRASGITLNYDGGDDDGACGERLG